MNRAVASKLFYLGFVWPPPLRRLPRAERVLDEHLHPREAGADQVQPVPGGLALLPVLRQRRRRLAAVLLVVVTVL